MDEGCDHVRHWLARPLGSHVADTFYGPELKSVVLLDVARDLSMSLPWPPQISDGPVELGDPLFGAPSWDGTIGVTRVEHNLDLVLQHAVNPV